MYFHKKPKYFDEIVEMVRISKNVAEKVFRFEVNNNFFCENVESAKNIISSKEKFSYHNDIEITLVLKTLLTSTHCLKISQYTDAEELKQFREFLKFTLKYRHQIAHNDLTKISSDKLMTLLDLVISVFKKLDAVYERVIKSRYSKYLANVRSKISEKQKNNYKKYFINDLDIVAEDLKNRLTIETSIVFLK
jgi:hypothetical protein